MASTRSLIVFFAVSLGLASSAVASDNPQASFTTLQSLVGSWKLTNPTSPKGAAFRITYRLISANTALVESFGDPAGQVTETIYHMDGERLVATHYCAQGNQPRLRLKTAPAKDSFEFEFFDATNLKSPSDSHMIRMKFELVDAKHFQKTEVYTESGKEDVTTLSLERVD